MLAMSSGDTSAYTKGVSRLIKLGVAVSVGHLFRGKVSQEIHSSVHSSTMVGKLVFKVH